MRLQARRPVRVGDQLLGGPAVLTCVPLVADDRATLIRQGGQIGALRPDCAEWRADYLPRQEPDALPALLSEIGAAAGCPIVVTNRLHVEGGHRHQDEEARIAILVAAAATGVPALVDVEMATSPALAERVSAAAHRSGVGVIRSWHDFSSTPSLETILSRLRAMQDAGGDVAKVAVMPRSPEDVLVLLRAGLEARRSFLEIPCILMSMGALGTVTRFGGGYFGSDLTYGVGLQTSAPGQVELGLVRRALAAMGLADPTGHPTGDPAVPGT